MQKKYGTTPEELELKEAGFQMMLAGYDIDEVEAAFIKYCKKHDDIPAPANIIGIIENRPVYSEAIYRQIKADILCPTTFVSKQEKQYLEDYKVYMLGEAGL